jgi:outer membrane receptor protein involved in Fe transport
LATLMKADWVRAEGSVRTASATIAWSHKSLGASLTARYLASYDDVNGSNIPTGREVPSKTLLDAQVTFSPGASRGTAAGWVKGLKIQAGVINLLDEGPNYSSLFLFGVDGTQVDPRQRFGYVSVSMAF